MANQSILVESGTNEIEILEVALHECSFGVNALKIREIVKHSDKAITALPGVHPSVMGCMLFHGRTVRVVNLASYLKMPVDRPNGDRWVVLVCEFNNQLTGFLVERANAILRVSWNSIQSPSEMIRKSGAPVTGIALIGDRQILMLDFESITESLFNSKPLLHAVETGPESDARKTLRGKVSVIVADDSGMIRKKVAHLLEQAGYRNLILLEDGAQAFQAISRIPNGSGVRHLLITDIEMPQMDGFALCLKSKSILPELKVLVLSSMITDQMSERCRTVGADSHLSKAEIDQLIRVADQLCLT